MFDQIKDIRCMRPENKQAFEFQQLFKMAYANYFEGEWEVAKRLLTQTLKMNKRPDGPSAALLKFMELHDFVAPATWIGVHDLHKVIND